MGLLLLIYTTWYSFNIRNKMGSFIGIGFVVAIVAAMLGIFYRNCLKGEKMIFNPIYRVLSRWVDNKENGKEIFGLKMSYYQPTTWSRFKAWIAFPLGYCIYCTTTWITIILYFGYTGYDAHNYYLEGITYYLVVEYLLGFLLAIGLQHLIIVSACRWIIHNHPDFDPQVNGLKISSLADIHQLDTKRLWDESMKEEEIPLKKELKRKPLDLTKMRQNLVRGYFLMQNGDIFELWYRDEKGKTHRYTASNDLFEIDKYIKDYKLYANKENNNTDS